MTSLREILLVGRFEVLRAVRTWRAMALFLLYGIAYGGASYIAVAILHALENSAAKNLGVATTDRPGALLDALVKTDMFRDIVVGLTGNEVLLEQLTTIPPLAIFGMWLGLVLIPFFAASTAAECISIDLASRALRFEALRVGRLELLLGRFAGQLTLTLGATVLGLLVTWCVGMLFMVGHTPQGLAAWLVGLAGRAWLFSVPFAGLGVACSALTTSAAWARVIAVGATGASWILYGVARWFEGGDYTLVADVALQLLPQGWMRMLWDPGFGWTPAALVLVTLGLAMVGLGHVRFSTRDL